MKNKKIILWPFIIIAYLGMFSFGLYDNSRGPIYPSILKDFNILPSVGSWIFVFSSLAGLCTTLVGNIWLKRLGTYKSMQVSFVMQIMAALFMGLSCQFGYHFYFLLLSSFAFGISSGILSICANIMISHSVDVSTRRRTFSGLHSMYGLASLLAPVLLNICYSLNIEWNQYFYLMIFIPGLTLILSFFLKTPTYIHSTGINYVVPKANFKIIIFPCFLFGIYVASEIIVSSQLVYLLEISHHFTKAVSNYYLSLFFLTLLLGRLTFTVIKLPLRSLHWLLISLISSLILFMLGLMVHPIFLPLLGLTQSFFYPCAMDWLYEKHQSVADSIVPYIMTSISLSLIIMHFMVGQLAVYFGISKAMYLGPCLVIVALLGIIIERRFPLKR